MEPSPLLWCCRHCKMKKKTKTKKKKMKMKKKNNKQLLRLHYNII